MKKNDKQQIFECAFLAALPLAIRAVRIDPILMLRAE
jgi:hypothetical protein